jgi:DNA-binding NarL/FixJ family response regulator
VPDDPSVRLAIRSDRRLFHDALAACIAGRTPFTVVGHVTHGRDLLDLCRLRQPDIVLFDAGADIATSARLLTDLLERHRDLRLVVTYEHLTRDGIAVAARLGINSLVPHSHGLDALVATLHRNAEDVRSRLRARHAVEPGLTAQEREIITLLAAGHTADRVAEFLCVSLSAVENSKRRIYQKMRVTNQSHAIARAATLGLVDRPLPGVERRASERKAPRLRPDEPGTTLRVMVLGPDTLIRHRLAVALLHRHIPFMINPCTTAVAAAAEAAAEAAAAPGASATTTVAGPSAFAWNGRLLDPVAAVLADPEPGHWDMLDDVDLPMLLIRSRPMSRADAMAALARGVVGMIDSEGLEQNLLPALMLTAAGHLTVSSTLADGVIAGIRVRSGDPHSPLPQLTPRERDILNSIAAGHTVRQTARTLGIAQKTVENIQARLFRKLSVRNRAGAAATAHALGLIDAEETAELARYSSAAPI